MSDDDNGSSVMADGWNVAAVVNVLDKGAAASMMIVIGNMAHLDGRVAT